MALDAVFSQIFNMSLTGSVVILCVLAVRLLLKKAPKKFAYALWAVVLFRLLCPVSLPAPVSVLEVVQPEVTVQNGFATQVHYLPAPPSQPAAEVTPVSPAPAAPKPATPSLSARDIAVLVWAAGAAAMMGLSVYQYLRLKCTLRRAVPLQGNVYLTGSIPTPFVLGIFQPKIYLPTGVTMAERPYILAHERCHIRRCDHILKLLAYGALCLHWFNPLVWVAFLLAGKDMEMSCDEAVIRQMGPGIRADYAAALLRLSTGKPILAPSPLAFGEGNTKGRIIHMSQWKKPKIWVSVLSVLVCIAILTACAVNPQTDKPVETPSESTAAPAEPLLFELAQMTIPEELHYVFLEDSVRFYYGEAFNEAVGGITIHSRPDFELVNADGSWNGKAWVAALGLPEAAPGAKFSYEISDEERGVNGYPQYGDLAAAYTTAPEDQPANIHFFYILRTEVYDFWFDQRKVSRDQITAMMDSAFVDVSAQPPVDAFDGFALIGPLPDQCSITVDRFGTLTFTDGDITLGGVQTFPLPADLSGDWMRQLPLWEWEDETLGSMADGNTIEFFSDVPPDQERTVLRSHNFIFGDTKLIDVWFDGLVANPSVQRAIFNSVGVSASPLLTVEPTAPYFNPPPGFTLSTQNSQTYTIKKGDQVVGGLSAYPIPDTYDPTDRIYLWLERSGISDFGNPDLFYNGGITSGEGWSAQFSKADSDHKSTARYHIFFIGDDMVQDFWLEYDKLRDDERSDLIHGLSIPEQPKAPDPDSSPEAKAYYVCSQLIEEVSESEWRIQGPVEDKNGDAMVVVFTNDNGLQLRLNMTPVAQAKKYLETEEPRSILNGYKMNKSYATYLDTVTSSEGVYYQFRMNAMYADQPGYEKEFYGDFYFDSDQETFQRLELTVHPKQENELRITEIVEYEND